MVGSSRNKHLRAVDERGRELALHPLAERERAGGLVDQVSQLEQLGELGEGAAELGLGHLVDGPVEGEGLRGREVPEELLLLAHDQGDLLEERVLAALGHVAVDPDLAGRGEEQAGEDLEGGGLPRAVGAEEPHPLAAGDLERDAVHRLHHGGDAPEERAQGGLESRRTLVDGVVLPQSLHRHHGLSHRVPLLACYALHRSGEPRPRSHRRRSARRVSGRRSQGAGGAVRKRTPPLPGRLRRLGGGDQRLRARRGGGGFPPGGGAPGEDLARR